MFSKFRKNEPKKDLKEEIFDHICDLLNTKATFSAYQKDFGLDNYGYVGSNKQFSKKIIQDIKVCLERFENRIQIEEIVSLPNKSSLYLSFLIKCKIKNASHAFQLSFHNQRKSFGQEISDD